MAIDQVDPPMVSQPTNLVAVSVLMADSRRPSTTMKAIVQDSYGPPASVLKLREVAKPSVSDGEVLVRVHAASIHTGDFILARGLPYFLRFVTGVRKPKLRVPGTDVAGTVEAVGKDVSLLEVGDEVFGWCTGAFAEYVSATEEHFVQKPANLTFEQASAVGVSATTALQLLRDQGKLQPGQTVLINGAAGGLGTFAVQIAKTFGTEVTGVCGTGSVDMIRSIGADHVIDYTKHDFTKGTKRYDFILDNVGNHSLAATRGALTPDGTVQPNGGGHSAGRWVGSMGGVIKTALSSKIERRQLAPSIKTQNRKDLVALKALVESGKVTPVIDSTFPLSRTPEALGHVGDGHARGTVVITM
jgi:NADPH:quinone reductase-like Zn-dependent oxidoreductase